MPAAKWQLATGGRVGLLGNRSNADIPFTQNTYTEQLIRDQQDRRVNDVFDNDPGVRATECATYRKSFPSHALKDLVLAECRRGLFCQADDAAPQVSVSVR